VNRSLARSEVLPFVSGFGLLIVAALVADVILHALKLSWIGRWLGIPGSLLIILSFLYSLRKRKFITASTPARLLELHELFAWIGSLMVLVHAGIHLHAWLPWVALAAMLVNVASGYVGRMLLGRSRRRVETRREALQASGIAPEEVDRALFWDAIMLDAMKGWRAVHLPITIVFTVTSLAHIVSIALLWGWR
jgi:hypothetical protein